ncbi:glycerophosphodiester phosphodiesterase [Carnobacterium maltaromaticum]|uniref:glycerophosphodiester phosphodiesterase n=1 Tax=Carnobacterium maltaromaticum TaxID=2751 RepID=UPI002093C370
MIHSLIVAFVLFISFLPLIVIEKILNGAAPVIAGITLTFIQWFLFIFYGLLQALLADALTHLAYPIAESSHFEINREQNPAFLFKPKRFMYWGVFAAFLGMSIVNTFSVSKVIYQPTTAIIAHRGYTAEGVENTISSLDAAARIGADYVEMDIQETKDHQFVVFHDSTLSRLSNRSERISDLTLAELQKIDVSSGGFTDKIPSFEDYIAAAKKDNIKLLVEIKLHGRESKDMEKNLVALLQKEKVTETYLVQSLDEATIKKVKKLDPVIKTGYLVALNIGNLPQISADFLVLEEFSFNTRLLEQARQQDKMVFVWTVNDEDLMRRYLALDVDGLITNYPSDAIGIRDSFDENKTFVERIEDLLN